MLIAAQTRARARGCGTCSPGRAARTHTGGTRRNCSSSSASSGTPGARRLAVLRAAQAAGARLRAGRRPGGRPARRAAGGVNPTLVNHIADRIRSSTEQGKTFLIVEHNMEFVMGLCHHHGARVGRHGDKRAAGDRQDGPARARRLPRARTTTMTDPDSTGDRGRARAGHGGRGGRLRRRGRAARRHIQVPEGCITCVVGPNGAGKSTLLRVISGLLRPRLGTVTLHGEQLTGKSPRQILKPAWSRCRRTTACSTT